MQLSRAFWASRSYPLFAPDGTEGGGTGTGNGEGDPANAGTEGAKDGDGKGKGDGDLDGIEGLGDAGKEAIRKERAAAKAANDALKDVQKKLADLEKDKADREAAEAKAKEDEAKQKGEFEQLAAKREEERDAAKADVTRLTAENDQYRAAVEKVLADEWKALPAEAIEAYAAAGGKDDDPLGKLSFLPAGKKIAAKLAEKGEAQRGNGPNPRPGGNGTVPDADKRKAQAGMYRNF